jgi:hypothetical protein
MPVTNKWIKQRELREHLETEQYIKENTLRGQLESLKEAWIELKKQLLIELLGGKNDPK